MVNTISLLLLHSLYECSDVRLPVAKTLAGEPLAPGAVLWLVPGVCGGCPDTVPETGAGTRPRRLGDRGGNVGAN